MQSRVEKNRISQGIEEVKKILSSQKPNAKKAGGDISERERNKTLKSGIVGFEDETFSRIMKTIFKEDQIASLFKSQEDKKQQSVENAQVPSENEKKAG